MNRNHYLSALAMSCLLASGLSLARDSLRIDASSDASAQRTWKKMVASASPEERQQLIIALLKLNLAGVSSAYEVAGNPELQTLSAARIKDKISGLTADEIIELAERTSTAEPIIVEQTGS